MPWFYNAGERSSSENRYTLINVHIISAINDLFNLILKIYDGWLCMNGEYMWAILKVELFVPYGALATRVARQGGTLWTVCHMSVSKVMSCWCWLRVDNVQENKECCCKECCELWAGREVLTQPQISNWTLTLVVYHLYILEYLPNYKQNLFRLQTTFFVSYNIFVLIHEWFLSSIWFVHEKMWKLFFSGRTANKISNNEELPKKASFASKDQALKK